MAKTGWWLIVDVGYAEGFGAQGLILHRTAAYGRTLTRLHLSSHQGAEARRLRKTR